MRELALVGLIAVAFGLGSYYATGTFGWFSAVNLGAGTAALLAALVLGARRMRFVGGPASRPVVLRGLGKIALALALAVGLERAAAFSGIQFDWTLERSFDLAPATVKALTELCEDPASPLRATLYTDPQDPRKRRTRLLLRTLAQHGCVVTDEKLLDEAAEDADLFGIGSSNTVVLVLGDRFTTVERPTEGSLYENLYRLRSIGTGTVTVLRGDGEGNVLRDREVDFSGLAAALDTEGYSVRTVVSAAMSEVPDPTDVLLVIAPRRRLPDSALAAIQRYLLGGGRLVAMLEPGAESGLEDLLAEWGLASPDRVVIDPASGAFESRVPGICPVAFNYEAHPVTRGLDSNRMTFFCGARAFELHKPRPEDHVQRVVLSSHRAWLSDDLSLLERHGGEPDADGAQPAYQPLAAAGVYERDGHSIRIVAFGDSDFANNKNLRALYNLDLALNAVHWAAERESEITFRPKIRETVQFPLPLANTLHTLYGVGLLVPELLLICGGLVWLRRRN